jgi:hypothetical protein
LTLFPWGKYGKCHIENNARGAKIQAVSLWNFRPTGENLKLTPTSFRPTGERLNATIESFRPSGECLKTTF